MSRIVFINRFYKPDNSATSQILTSLAEHLSSKAMKVVVATSRLNYVTGKKIYGAHEEINGVSIHRLQTTAFGRMRLSGRAIDYLSFYVNCFIFLLFKTNRHDVVVVKTDPPMLSVIALVASTLKQFPYITWNQDLFPEIAERSLSGTEKRRIYNWLIKIRNISLSKALMNVCIGELMSERLQRQTKKSTRHKVIPNWNISPQQSPVTPQALKTSWELKDKFIVGYSGNLGKAHNPEVLFKAIEKLSKVQNIHFLFVGGGSGMHWLKKEVENAYLVNTTFLPYQPLEQLNSSLRVPDVHLVSLMSDMEGLVVPSKFYGILAANRPIIFVGGKDGELVRLICKHQCGISVNENESQELVSAIQQYYTSPNLINTHADNAKLAYQQHYLPSISLDRWYQSLFSAQQGDITLTSTSHKSPYDA